jgi:hypothetical protein
MRNDKLNLSEYTPEEIARRVLQTVRPDEKRDAYSGAGGPCHSQRERECA